MFDFEHKSKPLLGGKAFLVRLLSHLLLTTLLLAGSLGIGVVGYHECENLAWLDSLLNASMLLTGMGPLHSITTDAGKWFASVYALFSGLVFLGAVGVGFAPLFHRLMHRFHLDQ